MKQQRGKNGKFNRGSRFPLQNLVISRFLEVLL